MKFKWSCIWYVLWEKNDPQWYFVTSVIFIFFVYFIEILLSFSSATYKFTVYIDFCCFLSWGMFEKRYDAYMKSEG